MDRILVIPAAGSGTRLGSQLPKPLVEVNGRPMLDHLLDLYARDTQQAVVVAAPHAVDRVTALVKHRRAPVSVVVQEQPTGMLDAILLAHPVVEAARPRRVLITWCDQVAITPRTVAAVVAAAATEPEPALVLPTCCTSDPYVHIVRDGQGGIERVLHRREGDAMPPAGESDAGVFDLAAVTYLDWLQRYAEAPAIGAVTGERNFVPFVAWVAHRGAVVTVSCQEPEEAVGINTRQELARLESHLRLRAVS